MNNPFGWAYPAGAEHDPNAPWNQPDDPESCMQCGADFDEDTAPMRDLRDTNSEEGDAWAVCAPCAGEAKCSACDTWGYKEDVWDDDCAECEA